jgi:hypothetical protein
MITRMFKKPFNPQLLQDDFHRSCHEPWGSCSARGGRSPHAAVKVTQPAGSALRALTAAALILPGLGLAPSSAMAETPVTLDAGPSVSASAYVPTGASRLSGTLAKNTDSSKRYRVECYDDGSGKPAYMKVRIQNKTKAAKYNIRATLERNGEKFDVDDTKNGDGLFSGYVQVKQGEGDYILTVSKSKKKLSDKDNRLSGKAVFETRQECDTESGAYTGIRKPVSIP